MNVVSGQYNKAKEPYFELVKHRSIVTSFDCLLLRVRTHYRHITRTKIMISAATVAKVFASLMGCYAMGYSIGVSIKWVKKISQAA